MKSHNTWISILGPEYFIQYSEGPDFTKSAYMQAIEFHQRTQEVSPFFMIDFHVLKILKIQSHQ